jgi:CheY-like chemotaxis protein
LLSSVGQGTTLTFTIRVPVAVGQAPVRDLDGLRVALAIQSGSLRNEVIELLKSWRADVHAAEARNDLVNAQWDIALVDVSDDTAAELTGQAQPTPGLPPDKTLALVPISLSSESRAALRAHFRLLINRPIHHGPLFAMLSGSRPSRPIVNEPATQFGFRVLVVEDNEVNQRLLLRVLAGLGCTGSVVENGLQAIAELNERAANYDVVLLDLHMPEMDGLQALERIRRGEAGSRARTMWVIALTADARPEQRARGFATGLNDYLTKPLRTPELEAALRRYRTERLARKT